MHLADAFIQSDLQCIQVIHFFVSTCVPWQSNPQPLRCYHNALTTEPQEHFTTSIVHDMPCIVCVLAHVEVLELFKWLWLENSGYSLLTERSFQKAFHQLLCLWPLCAWRTQLTGWSLTCSGCYLKTGLSRSLWLWTEQTNRSLSPAPALWRMSRQSYLMTEASRSHTF